MSWQIDPLDPKDAQSAIDHMVACFGEEIKPLAQEDIDAALTQSVYQPLFLVAKQNGEIAGLICSIMSSAMPYVQCFSWLSVNDQYRRQGLAAALLEKAEQHAIDTVFKGHAGSFLLASATDPDYYRAKGYEGSLPAYDGTPFMIKHYRP